MIPDALTEAAEHLAAAVETAEKLHLLGSRDWAWAYRCEAEFWAARVEHLRAVAVPVEIEEAA